MKIFLFSFSIFIGIFFSQHAFAGSEMLSCAFPNKSEITTIETCAEKSKSGSLKIRNQALEKIQFDTNGLAGGSISKIGCYWLNKKGVLRKTYCFDNGADYFEEGLARYIDNNGKFGYMNEQLKITIPAKYSFAFPFKNAYAKVCMKCAKEKAKDLEHSVIIGGEWLIIDTKGKISKKCPTAKTESECVAESN